MSSHFGFLRTKVNKAKKPPPAMPPLLMCFLVTFPSRNRGVSLFNQWATKEEVRDRLAREQQPASPPSPLHRRSLPHYIVFFFRAASVSHLQGRRGSQKARLRSARDQKGAAPRESERYKQGGSKASFKRAATSRSREERDEAKLAVAAKQIFWRGDIEEGGRAGEQTEDPTEQMPIERQLVLVLGSVRQRTAPLDTKRRGGR